MRFSEECEIIKPHLMKIQRFVDIHPVRKNTYRVRIFHGEVWGLVEGVAQYDYKLLFTKARIIYAKALVSINHEGELTVPVNFYSVM